MEKESNLNQKRQSTRVHPSLPLKNHPSKSCQTCPLRYHPSCLFCFCFSPPLLNLPLPKLHELLTLPSLLYLLEHRAYPTRRALTLRKLYSQRTPAPVIPSHRICFQRSPIIDPAHLLADPRKRCLLSLSFLILLFSPNPIQPDANPTTPHAHSHP